MRVLKSLRQSRQRQDRLTVFLSAMRCESQTGHITPPGQRHLMNHCSAASSSGNIAMISTRDNLFLSFMRLVLFIFTLQEGGKGSRFTPISFSSSLPPYKPGKNKSVLLFKVYWLIRIQKMKLVLNLQILPTGSTGSC